MSKITFIVILFLALLAACSENPSSDKKKNEAAISSMSAKWTNAIIAKDLDVVMSVYSPEAVQLIVFGKMRKGKDAIREWYETWLMNDSLFYSASTEFIDISLSGDLAYERGNYRVNNESGRFLTIWKKTGGSWKVVSDSSIPEE